MEVYQEATQYTVDAVKDIINVILKISGSDKSDIDEIHLDTIEEIRCRKDNTGHFISDSEAYAELVKIGLVGNMIPTIEEYTRDFESDWRYPTTEVSIIPKDEAEHSDIAILNKINDLFCVEACYN